MKKVLTIVLMTMLMVFGGEAALAKGHDHKKCNHHKHAKVVYVDKKHRGHDDCKYCKSHRDKRYASKSCCAHHDDRYSRNDRRWERDHHHRGRVEDRRHTSSPSEARDRAITKVILVEGNRGGHRR